MNKKVLYTIVVLVIVAAGLVIWTKVKKQPVEKAEVTSQKQEKAVPPEPVVTKVDPAQLPGEFPADIPLEKDAKVIDNNSAKVGDRTQFTRMFVSKKTLAENYDLYKTWMGKNGWKVDSDLDQESLKALAGSKDGKNLSISINANTALKENTVNIIYSY